MRPTTKAAFAGSIEGGGKGRGLFGGAFATRGAFCGSEGSGARRGGRLGSLLAVLALATFSAALVAAPASAAPPVPTMGSVSEVSYASAQATGIVTQADNSPTLWGFECSTDEVNWSSCSGTAEVPGGEPQNVSGEITGLHGGTKYFIRIFTFDFFDFVSVASPAPYPEITTLSVDPPTVISINDAGSVDYTTAQVSGEVQRPNTNADPAFDAHCHFEYVLDAQFEATGFDGAPSVPCNVDPVETTVPQAVEAELTALKPGATYHLRLTAANAGGTDSLEAAHTFTTTAVASPSVTIFAPTAITRDSAHFSGEINPELGAGDPALYEVTWHFECTPECLNVNGEPLSGEPIAPDNLGHAVSGDAALEPNTEYHVTLVAANVGETAVEGPLSFTTDAPPPRTQTLGIGGAESDSAILAARINPLNSPVTYQFEWGPSASYANKAPAGAEPLGAVDNAFHVVTAPLSGLTPATTYHYRIVATNTQTGEKSLGEDRSFTTPLEIAPISCPNGPSRVGPSAALPDCRAYEWVTPGFNDTHIEYGSRSRWQILADGSALTFTTLDAVDDAESNEVNVNRDIATRGPDGWATKSLMPTLKEPVRSYGHPTSIGLVSEDLSQSIVQTIQPLTGSTNPGGGGNFFLHRADGTFVPLTNTGSGLNRTPEGCCAASRDFTHIFFTPIVKQLPTDPINEGNTYEWVNGHLSLVGIIPGLGPEEVPAPSGAKLAGVSDDGSQVLFKATEFPGLYLRTNDKESVDVATSQRSQDPDLNPVADAKTFGISGDGGEVLFTSASELTEDANTGQTGGVANDGGSDLYSYDVGSADLADLTVDNDPANAGTGANVTRVLGAARDYSYVYFVATGKLAQGAISGAENVYVEHEGAIDFIADSLSADPTCGCGNFYVTPDGTHAAFLSQESLTGYENAGQPELFEYTYRGALQCASCRPSGAPPSAAPVIFGRTLSDDGSRVFFQSSDAILPNTNGLANVYEYQEGQVHLLSPSDGQAPAYLFGASASGGDVFFSTYGELTPMGQGSVNAVYDARVNADIAKAIPPQCQGEGCRSAPTAAPNVPSAGSATLNAPLKIAVSGSRSVKGSKTSLRVVVPARGKLSVFGKGLKLASKKASQPGSVTITVALKPGANKTRLSKGVFKAKAEVLFKSSSGQTSRGMVSLKFEDPTKKGGK